MDTSTSSRALSSKDSRRSCNTVCNKQDLFLLWRINHFLSIWLWSALLPPKMYLVAYAGSVFGYQISHRLWLAFFKIWFEWEISLGLVAACSENCVAKFIAWAEFVGWKAEGRKQTEGKTKGGWEIWAGRGTKFRDSISLDERKFKGKTSDISTQFSNLDMSYFMHTSTTTTVQPASRKGKKIANP